MTLSKVVKILYTSIGTISLGLIIWFYFFFSPVQLPELSTSPPTSTFQPLPTQTTLPTSTPVTTPTSTLTPSLTLAPLVEYYIIREHFGEIELIEFVASANWELEKLGEWPERYLGEKTGSMCANYALRKKGTAVLFITPSCGFGESIASECSPGTNLFWEEDEQDEFGRRSAYARYYDEEGGAYIYASAWIGNMWTTGRPGVFCMYTSSEIGDDNYLKAQYFGNATEEADTLQELDQIVLSIVGIEE